jgi:hypothetical protein
MSVLRWLFLVIMIVLIAASALAEAPQKPGDAERAEPQYRPMLIDNSTWIDANNINMVVTNHGSFAYDLTTQDPGLEFPKGTDKQCVYAGGIWLGCKVQGAIRVTAGSFTQEYTPGPILEDGSWRDVNDPVDHTYKIVKGDTTSEDYRNWPAELGAPVDAEGKPLLIGDQTLWCVYNDADPSVHNADEGRTDPLGVEIQQTTFAFDWTGALGNVVFIKFLIINKLSNRLDSTYVAVWCDPDVGGASDDYVGCDTTLSMGYAYNATNQDNVYGGTPPSVGYDFFKGPIGDDDKELPMTSFNMYINATDPRATLESYNYMRGLDLHGAAVIDPLTDRTTKFMLPGDPVANTGWLDSDPADRRFMVNSGPFTMMPGDTQEVVVGIVVGQGNDRLGSVAVMKFFDQTAQIAFDLGFNLPEAPARPVVSVAELDRMIKLSWGAQSEIETAPGYTFQGYNVYQSGSVSSAGPWQLIAVYDIIDGIGTIYDLTLNVDYGVPIYQPVEFGTDAGIQRYIEITEDKVRGLPLYNGRTYYYRVAAYSYNPEPAEGLPATLESSSPILAVIPQEEASDVVIQEELPQADVTQGRINDELPPTTDKVIVGITNPFELTGDTYRVDFRQADPPDTLISGSDTTIAYYEWNLRNRDTGLYFYDDWQTNKSGNGDYLVTDGFVAKVVGTHVAELVEADYLDPSGAQSRAVTGVDAGGCDVQINGSGYYGVCYGINFFGSTLDPVANANEFTTVEVRIDRSNTQKGYRYVRPGYAYTGFFDVPFTAWDAVTGEQLNVCFVENEGSAVFDSTWDLDATDTGGREYLFIMRSEYDPEGGIYDDEYWGPEQDVLYAMWARMRTGYTFANDVLDGSMFKFIWANPASDNDYFEFTPESPSFSDTKAAGRLSSVKAVPNPYFAKSAYELNQFEHVVKFTNLPTKCTVRIFNLAGDLVRTLEKDDDTTSILEWDLYNENAIPVASGFYIYHVDAPDIGSTYGKMAVFLEKERLNTF